LNEHDVARIVRKAFAAGLRGEELEPEPSGSIAGAVKLRIGEMLVDALLPDLEDVLAAAMEIEVSGPGR
jgi:hypothetical protein